MPCVPFYLIAYNSCFWEFFCPFFASWVITLLDGFLLNVHNFLVPVLLYYFCITISWFKISSVDRFLLHFCHSSSGEKKICFRLCSGNFEIFSLNLIFFGPTWVHSCIFVHFTAKIEPNLRRKNAHSKSPWGTIAKDSAFRKISPSAAPNSKLMLEGTEPVDNCSQF